MRTNSNSLTQGSILKSLLFFALPLFLSNLLQQFYNVFDSWVVGRYLGDTALAAVSSSWSLIGTLIGFFSGTATGAGVLIARYFGAKDYKAMRTAIHTDIAFGLAAGTLLTVLGVTFTPSILRWMDTPETILPESISYFRYYFCGVIFTVMYNILVGILRALGDSKHPLYYLMVSATVNVILDLALVGGLGMGVGAAAMATTVSQGVSALLCCIRLLRIDEAYRLKIKDIRFERHSLRSIIYMGLPTGIQSSLTCFANMIVQVNINSFGDAAVAGCGSYTKIEGFAFLIITCIAMSLSTFVGQNLGAHKFDRVKKAILGGTSFCCVIVQAIGLVFYIFAPRLLSIFGASAEAIDYGVRYMRTLCPFYFVIAFCQCIASTLRGSGKTIAPMITLLVCWGAVRVAYITIAIRYVNRLETVSWSYPITWILSSAILLIYFLKSDWMHYFDQLDTKAKNA